MLNINSSPETETTLVARKKGLLKILCMCQNNVRVFETKIMDFTILFVTITYKYKQYLTYNAYESLRCSELSY